MIFFSPQTSCDFGSLFMGKFSVSGSVLLDYKLQVLHPQSRHKIPHFPGLFWESINAYNTAGIQYLKFATYIQTQNMNLHMKLHKNSEIPTQSLLADSE